MPSTPNSTICCKAQECTFLSCPFPLLRQHHLHIFIFRAIKQLHNVKPFTIIRSIAMILF